MLYLNWIYNIRHWYNNLRHDRKHLPHTAFDSLNPVWHGKISINQFQSDFLGSKSKWLFNPRYGWWFGTIIGKKKFTWGPPNAPEKFKNTYFQMLIFWIKWLFLASNKKSINNNILNHFGGLEIMSSPSDSPKNLLFWKLQIFRKIFSIFQK